CRVSTSHFRRLDRKLGENLLEPIHEHPHAPGKLATVRVEQMHVHRSARNLGSTSNFAGQTKPCGCGSTFFAVLGATRPLPNAPPSEQNAEKMSLATRIARRCS